MANLWDPKSVFKDYSYKGFQKYNHNKAKFQKLVQKRDKLIQLSQQEDTQNRKNSNHFRGKGLKLLTEGNKFESTSAIPPQPQSRKFTQKMQFQVPDLQDYVFERKFRTNVKNKIFTNIVTGNTIDYSQQYLDQDQQIRLKENNCQTYYGKSFEFNQNHQLNKSLCINQQDQEKMNQNDTFMLNNQKNSLNLRALQSPTRTNILRQSGSNILQSQTGEDHKMNNSFASLPVTYNSKKSSKDLSNKAQVFNPITLNISQSVKNQKWKDLLLKNENGNDYQIFPQNQNQMQNVRFYRTKDSY